MVGPLGLLGGRRKKKDDDNDDEEEEGGIGSKFPLIDRPTPILDIIRSRKKKKA